MYFRNVARGEKLFESFGCKLDFCSRTFSVYTLVRSCRTHILLATRAISGIEWNVKEMSLPKKPKSWWFSSMMCEGYWFVDDSDRPNATKQCNIFCTPSYGFYVSWSPSIRNIVRINNIISSIVVSWYEPWHDGYSRVWLRGDWFSFGLQIILHHHLHYEYRFVVPVITIPVVSSFTGPHP